MLLRVVIVEDEEIIRKGLVFAIDWLGLGCVIAGSARDGQEGLEVIERVRPDIVLTDIKMPGMSGLTMVERALERHRFYSVILTSYSEFDLARAAVHLGVADYLLKPVDEDELRQAVDRIRKKIIYTNKYDKLEQIAQGHILTAWGDWKIFESAKNSMDPYVRRTYEIIRRQYSGKIGIHAVAEELGVSASYLSRKLKSSLNITFVDLLNQYRVKMAMQLLNKGTLRIYEISDQLGFSEYKHFCSVFKKYTSVTPTEFVKNGGVRIVEGRKGGGGDGDGDGDGDDGGGRLSS